MTIPNWKLISSDVVWRVWPDDGHQESCSTSAQEYLDWLAQGNTPDPADEPTPEQQLAALSSAVQAHLDDTARQRGYDTADRCASYANSTNPTWAAEAAAFISWRDACWAYMFGLTPPYPTVTELLAALPVMEWPR